MKNFLILPVVALALMACSPSTDHSSHDMKQTKTTSIDGEVQSEAIAITQARVLPPFPGKDTAAAYFTLESAGQDNRLVSVSSPISDAVEIHNHIEDNGVMKMRRVEGVTLTNGEAVEFKPGSYHIMMFKADLPNDKNEVELTLNFETGSSMTLMVPVEGREGGEEHSDH